MATFNIEINGISQSVNAVDNLIGRLDDLENRIESVGSEGVDVSDLRGNLESVRRSLEDNVDSWEEIADLIEHTTDSVELLERHYRNMENPFESSDVRNYARDIDRLTDSVEDMSNIQLDNITDINTTNAVRQVNNLTDALEGTQRAEDLLGTGFTTNIGGMSLQFDDVNLAIGVLEDSLYNLTQRGDTNSLMFNDISNEIVRLRRSVILVDDAIDNTLSGGMNRLMGNLSSITSLFSIGLGISLLFGLEDTTLDESILKFAALSLILQGLSELLQLLASNTSLASRGFLILSAVATPAVEGLASGFNRLFPVFDRFNLFANSLRAADLTNLLSLITASLQLGGDNVLEWNNLLSAFDGISSSIREATDLPGFRDSATLFGDVSGITEELNDLHDAGTLTDEQFQRANEALLNWVNNLPEGTRLARQLREELSRMGVIFTDTPPALTRMQRGLITLSHGIRVVGTAIRGLLKATIILGLLLAAIEGISKIINVVVDQFKEWAGNATLINKIDATTNAIDATNASLERYIDNLNKLEATKAIGSFTRITDSLRLYNKALIEAVDRLKTFNAFTNTGKKSLDEWFDVWANGTTWFSKGIDNMEEFKERYLTLLLAVQAGTDEFGKSGKGWLNFDIFNWFTIDDAKADLAILLKALIEDLLNKINKIDMSKGIGELEELFNLMNTPLYALAIANIENLYPKEDIGKVLAANIAAIKDYYKLIKDLEILAQVEKEKLGDTIADNNIAAIKDRMTKERLELENNYRKELRDAADNEELKNSIKRKYHQLRLLLEKSQAAELRGIRDQINNNEIAAMEDGLAKLLAQIELNRKQEIDAAIDSEIDVDELIAAINKKYDKEALDAKKSFYETRLLLTIEYKKLVKDLELEIAQMEKDIAVSQSEGRSAEAMAALGFTEETIANIRAYYDKIRDISNLKAKEIADANVKLTKVLTDKSLEQELERNRERLELIDKDYSEGKISKETYDKAILDETELHYKMLDVITRKGEQDILDILREYNETAKNNNITAINERVSAISDAYSKIKVTPKANGLGIINYKETKKELTKAKDEYGKILGLIGEERDNLQEQFDKKEISFGDFRLANKELDDLEVSVEDAQKNIGMELKNLLNNVIQSITLYVGQYVNAFGDIWSTYNDIQMARIELELARLDEELKMLEDAYRKQEELTLKHTDKLADINDELKDSRGDRRAHLIELLNAERAAQLESLLAELAIQKEKEANQKKLDALEKKRREQEKKNSIVQATINTFTAVTNALAVQPWFVGLALSAVALAMGMANVAQIKKLKYSKGGLLVGNSHANGGIPVGLTGIEVEGNEYVVNKNSTAKNLPLIDYINRSKRSLTIDDLNDFYRSGKANATRYNKSKYADGGLLPNIPNLNKDNTIVIQDDRPIVALIVDIVNSADNYRLILVLAGLSGSKSV